MIEELSTVVLTHDLPAEDLREGDVGAVVHVYKGRAAYEAEFVAADGHTVAVLTLRSEDIRPMRGRELLHVRQLA